jgi:hypothetical protein
MNNYYNAYKIVEPFNIDYTATKSFESNSSINKTMMASALNNLINNCKNDVMQKNMVELSALAIASNTIRQMNYTASNITYYNINQTNNAGVTVGADINTNIINTVSESVSSSINKKINNETNNNNLINQQNIAELTEAMNSLPIVPGVSKPSVIDQIEGIIGLGSNSKNNNIDIDINLQIKKMLNIDDSLTINESNKITNDIQNMIEQINYVKCSAKAMAINNIFLYEGKIDGDVIINDGDQEARAHIMLNCTINQENVSNISNNILTNISTNINNLYAGIERDPSPEKYKFLYLLSKAVSDKIITADSSGMQNALASSAPALITQSTPKSTPVTRSQEIQTSSTPTPQTNNQPVTPPPVTPPPVTPPPVTPPPVTPQSPPITPAPSFFETNKYLIFGGIIILTIMIIIIIIIIKKDN